MALGPYSSSQTREVFVIGVDDAPDCDAVRCTDFHIPRFGMYALFALHHWYCRQPHELRERWRGAAAGAAQFRDQAVERHLRMPVEFAQIDLLELPAARAPDVEEAVIRGQRDADHRQPTRLLPALHQPVAVRSRP